MSLKIVHIALESEFNVLGWATSHICQYEVDPVLMATED